MWQKIKTALSQVPHIGVTNRNFLMISADVKRGRIMVSYKKKVVSGIFNDRTLDNMMKGVRFEKNAQDFLMALAKLINQVTK